MVLLIFREFACQDEGSKSIHQKVNEQNECWLDRPVSKRDRTNKDVETKVDANGCLVLNELPEVFVNVPAELNSFEDQTEVIVNYQVTHFLRKVGSTTLHCHSYIRLRQCKTIANAVARKASNLVQLGECLGECKPLFRRAIGHHSEAVHET